MDFKTLKKIFYDYRKQTRNGGCEGKLSAPFSVRLRMLRCIWWKAAEQQPVCVIGASSFTLLNCRGNRCFTVLGPDKVIWTTGQIQHHGGADRLHLENSLIILPPPPGNFNLSLIWRKESDTQKGAFHSIAHWSLQRSQCRSQLNPEDGEGNWRDTPRSIHGNWILIKKI